MVFVFLLGIHRHERTTDTFGPGSKHSLSHYSWITPFNSGEIANFIQYKIGFPQPPGKAWPFIIPVLGNRYMPKAHDCAGIDHTGIGIISGTGKGHGKKNTERYGKRCDKRSSFVPCQSSPCHKV